MVLYVAADAPLSEIAATNPSGFFSARPIEGDEEAVRRHFTKSHVYFLGAHGGCSCGFSYGLGEDDEEDQRGRESVRQLRQYLDAATAQVGAVEVYACWVDDEAEPAASSQTLGTDQFTDSSESFELPERWFANIRAPAS
jgi:hypothetical protein